MKSLILTAVALSTWRPKCSRSKFFVYFRSGHSYQVDYYALGILLYELLFGKSPFYAPKKEDIFFSILNSEPKFPKSPNVSKEVKSLIKGLLAKNPNHRIGSLKGIKEISSHPWLRGYSYDEKNLLPPVHPTVLINNLIGMGSKDNKKMKDEFEQEKVAAKFNRYFFESSYVNQELMEKV
jgi:serine/threonine protein kinase